MASALFDALLSATIVGVAVRVLTTPRLFQAVVLFIVFGLLMSLAWTRLQAVDVALAEAAIGAGLTGALFLNALGSSAPRPRRSATRWRSGLPIAIMASLLAAVVGRVILDGDGTGAGLGDLVAASMPHAGVSNPVTAVLLNFRAYDTLLEMAVLILAVAGVWGLGAAPARVSPPAAPPGPVLLALVRLLIPVMGIAAAYLLWLGSSAPGGAFQAGAVLGAAGILLVVSGRMGGPGPATWPPRALVALGFAAFLTVALALMRGPRQFLEYSPASAGLLILLIEALLMVSIATILIALFDSGGTQPQPQFGQEQRSARASGGRSIT